MLAKEENRIHGVMKIVLLLVTGIFFMSISYMLHLLVEHPYFFIFNDVSAHPEIYTNIYFQFVLYTICASGFMLLVLLAGAVLNISRMHRRTQSLYATVKDQMRAIETANEGIAILNEEGIYTYMNHAHAACYGYASPQDLIGKDWRTLYPAARVREFENDIFPSIGRDGKWSGTGSGWRIDGSEFMQELSLTHLEDGGLVCVVRDVDEKMRREAQMRMILMGVEAADDGIAIAAPDNRLLFMNRRYLTIHGYDPDDLEKYIGTDWRLLYNKTGQRQIDSDVIPATMMRGSWSGSIIVMRRDGSLFPADASLTKMPDGNVLGVVRDISERMNMKRESDEMRERLFHAHRMESIIRLNASIAENFNDILGSLHTYTELLKHKTKDDPLIRNCLRSIDDAYLKSEDLVGRMVTMVRGSDIGAEYADLAHVIRHFQGGPAMHLDMTIEELNVPVSAVQLQEAMRHIIDNAQEALPVDDGRMTMGLYVGDDLSKDLIARMQPTSGDPRAPIVRMVSGGTGRRFLTCGFLMPGRSYCRLTISDNGTGIAPEILPHIFDPHISTKHAGGRLGLGLSKVQRIVTGVGGAILMESAEGTGTHVHLFFPLTAAGNQASAGIFALPVGEGTKA